MAGRRRRRQSGDQSEGQDSFVDIVSNLVGILIILVMMTCARVKFFSSAEVQAEQQMGDRIAALEAARVREESLYQDVMQIDRQAKSIERERTIREAERDRLAVSIAMVEKRIDEYQSGLDSKQRTTFDLNRRIAESRERLDRIEQAAEHVVARPVEQEVLVNFPTPISRTVTDQEVHFRIKNGKVTQVPIKLLLGRVKNDLRNHLYEIMSARATQAKVGPIGGFTMIYEAAAVQQVDPATGMSGMGAVVTEAKFIPIEADPGETIEQAIQSDSEFMQTLAGYHPSTATVTVWVYPDSFNEFRVIREQLYRKQFAVAARFLNDGDYITGGINGTKSSAQ